VPDPSFVTQKALHLLNGGYDNDDEQALIRAAERNGRVGSWVVPKSAAEGDDVVINVARCGLFATGKIASRTSLRADWNGHRYGARLNSIKLIKPPITMKAVQDVIPGLGWAKYPRSIATPSAENAQKIQELILRNNSSEALAASDSALEEASLEELRASALGSATKSVKPEERKAIYRRRSKAIHLYVLRRANGRCEGCKKAGPFRTFSGSVYLEPHHIKRLADNGPDHPSKVIALCPNCHRRAHYGEDAKSFNSLLTRKLVEIEHRNN
jgi:cytochrome c553